MDTDDPYSAGAYGGSGAASHPLGPSPPTSHLDAFTPAFVRPPADPPAAPSQPRLYFAELGDAKLMGELPSTDPLSTLLNKHLPSHLRPPRDLSGSWSHPDPFAAHHTAPSWNAAVAVLEGVDEAALQEAVRTSSWRRIATLARFKIERYGAAQARAPEEEAVEGGSVVDVLEWWGVRLHALARLRLYSSMRTELVGLWSVLESIEMPEATQPQAPTTTTTAAAAAAPSSGDVSSSSLHSSPQQQRRIQARPTSSASTASITSTTSGHFVKRTSHARRTLASSPLVPFSLRVMRAREAKYRGDVRAAIDAHVELIGYCKLWIQKWRGARKRRERSKGAATVAGDGAGSEAGAEAKTEAEAIEQMRRQEAIWKDRATRVGLLLASLLAEAKDYATATAVLTPLMEQTRNPGASRPAPSALDVQLLSHLARLYMQSGSVSACSSVMATARELASRLEGQPARAVERLVMQNEALLAAFQGDYQHAEQVWREAAASQDGREGGGDEDGGVQDGAVWNDLAVAVFYQGKLQEPVETLQRLLLTSPSSVAGVDPFLFNLCTLHELRSDDAVREKRRILAQVGQWAGDGCGTSCLKLS